MVMFCGNSGVSVLVGSVILSMVFCGVFCMMCLCVMISVRVFVRLKILVRVVVIYLFRLCLSIVLVFRFWVCYVLVSVWLIRKMVGCVILVWCRYLVVVLLFGCSNSVCRLCGRRCCRSCLLVLNVLWKVGLVVCSVVVMFGYWLFWLGNSMVICVLGCVICVLVFGCCRVLMVFFSVCVMIVCCSGNICCFCCRVWVMLYSVKLVLVCRWVVNVVFDCVNVILFSVDMGSMWMLFFCFGVCGGVCFSMVWMLVLLMLKELMLV